MPNPIDGPAPVLRPGPRCASRGYGVGPDNGVWVCGGQPGHGGRVHVVFRSATWEPEVWFSWPTAEAMDADADAEAAACQSCSRGEDGGGYPCDCPAACGARYCQHPTTDTSKEN